MKIYSKKEMIEAVSYALSEELELEQALHISIDLACMVRQLLHELEAKKACND